MRQVTRWLILFCMLATTCIVGGCISLSKPDANKSTEDKASAETAFVLPDLSGKEVKFPGDYSGKKALLLFFSTG